MTQNPKPYRSISLRWRLVLPVFILCVSLAAWGGYALALTPGVPLDAARQLAGLLAATLGAGLIVCVFLLGAVLARRINRVTYVAEELTAGQRTARTGMQPTDEIGRMGHALDRYADSAQARQDELRTQLRRKRREAAHLLSVLEAMPEGVIVQDMDGRVILMNEQARKLLGSQRVFRSAGLHELTAIVTDKLGSAIAPGLYTLGDPQQVDLDGKVLSAQAAAIMSMADYRLGTVVLLRDITTHVQQERSRAALLQRLEQEVRQPLAQTAASLSGQFAGPQGASLARARGDLRAIIRHTAALQKIIVEMREIDSVSAASVKREQKPLVVEMLVWAIVNEWRQVAQANKLQLQVTVERKGLLVLGDERRLRWAIGNLIDNAIRYTPAGGIVTLEVKGEADNRALLRIRDNGTGISAEDMAHLFTRFYRGTPTLPDGRVLHAPGMGQGLYVARQIIEAHGGSIKVKSKPGVGTAVYLALPLTAGEGYELPHLPLADMDGETMPLKRRLDDDEL